MGNGEVQFLCMHQSKNVKLSSNPAHYIRPPLPRIFTLQRFPQPLKFYKYVIRPCEQSASRVLITP